MATVTPTNVVVLSNVSLPVGVTAFGPITPPIGLSSVQIAIDRTLFTSLTLVISLSLEVSRDNGVNFVPWIALQTRGGSLTNPRTLQPVVNDLLRGQLLDPSGTAPLPTDAATRIRGSVTSNEIAVTTVTLTVS